MKEKIKYFFALTDRGAGNTIKASFRSFFKYLSYMLPPMLAFYFLQGLINNELKPTHFYMIALAVISVIIYILLTMEYKMTYDVTYEESTSLRIELANKLKALPLSYFSTHSLAELSQTVMMDVNNIEMIMSHAIPEGMAFVVFLFVLTVLLCIGNLILGLIATIPMWISLALVLATNKIYKKSITKYYYKLLDNSNAFQEAFEMQQEIKSYSMRDSVRNDVLKKLDDTEKMHIVAELTMALISWIVGILPYLGIVLTAIVGTHLYAGGSVPLLYYLGFLMAATTIAGQYAIISEFILMAIYFDDSFKRIRDLRNEPIQEGEDKDIKEYDVALSNVEFKYLDSPVINNLSFVAKQNEVTAIVGPSGCGKTTVLRLISRLYDYDKGEITIGGENIKSISTKSLYDKISIVFQNVELFNTSILENIRLGRKGATDEEVLEAARLANVDDIVKRLKDGYNTIIGENGSKLSGGERQRISIARAFLKNAPIILLDEISASLDVENEMKIQDSLNKLTKGKTVIVISHRLKSIENADKIVVMNEGVIDAVGKHDEILNTSKLYASMIGKSKLSEEYVY